MFVASDSLSAVRARLRTPVSSFRPVRKATSDRGPGREPGGYDAMAAGYIDVATTYDAYFHAVELVHVAVRLALGDTLGVSEILVPGRVATPDILADMEYMWARDYED